MTPKRWDVSVVVPVYNPGQDLDRLVSSFAQQTGCRLQIVILDSGSTDGSRALAAGVHPIEWIDLKRVDFHHAHTRNLGVSLCRYPLIFFSVQDAWLKNSSALANLCTLLETNALAALSVAEEPKPDADAYARYCLWDYYREVHPGEESTRIDAVWAGSWRTKITAASIGNVGCLYRREVLVEHPFQGPFGEDFDLAVRLLKRGLRIGKTNQVTIVHSHNRPAVYALRRMVASRLLMTRLGVASPAQLWQPEQLLSLLGDFAQHAAAGGDPVRGLEPSLTALLAPLEIGDGYFQARTGHFDDVQAEAAQWGAKLVLDTDFFAKLLAHRLGWILGGVRLPPDSPRALLQFLETLPQGI